ncbi:hypothetical protein [Pelotalea chapellei]|uniref:Uncharacterized protein n=1 Tax=Pelotalea chapellei TaxID=44671 RepID=A0ABS5U5A4_9BACT|nr:hypothetical protein [Pelotalea chapellei]MBT1070827.1 hypothetical protein [Pelotalea chapellei]
MQIKIIIFTLVSILNCLNVLAIENPPIKAKVNPIDETIAKKFIRNNAGHINLKNLKSSVNIEPEQSFKINIRSKDIYIVSAHRRTPSDDNLFTCSVLLFDQSGVIKSAFDTMGNDDEKRPWYCDYVEAMSFKDYYLDGSLKIIGLYRGTAPSSEHFILPVIMKLNFNKPSLEIDEELTSKLEDADVTTIQGVRSYLKKHEKKD